MHHVVLVQLRKVCQHENLLVGLPFSAENESLLFSVGNDQCC